jgi:uncharacterized protein YciI
MKHFILLYEYVPDMAARRDPHRPGHLEHVGASEKRGEIVMAGPLLDPIDGALLVFNATDKSVVETFAKNDPYLAAGLILKHTVREWGPAFGAERLK